MTAQCRSCGRDIWWATTPGNSLIPLDAQPHPAGNLAVHRERNGDLIARPLKGDEEPRSDERRGISHFATCPNANAHRRRRTG